MKNSKDLNFRHDHFFGKDKLLIRREWTLLSKQECLSNLYWISFIDDKGKLHEAITTSDLKYLETSFYTKFIPFRKRL